MSPILDSIGSVKAYGWGSFAAAGDFESIATVTVGSGGAATVSFTSIPAIYTHLQLRWLVRTQSSNVTGINNILVSINETRDENSTNYDNHFLIGNGSSASASDSINTNGLRPGIVVEAGNTANVFAVGVMDILDYTDTNKYKTIRSLAGYDKNGAGSIRLISGMRRNTAAITSIYFSPPSQDPNAVWGQYSHFALYGIKGA